MRMTQFVRVSEEENDEAIEIPTEEDGGDQDGTLLLSSLIAQFPGACGLKYRSETGAMRGVRLAGGVLHPPNGFWNDVVYIVNFPKDSKRKVDEDCENPVSTKMKRLETTKRCSDLIVLGLPWKSNEEDVKDYFKQFGDLVLTQVKRDPRTQMSKGFGFIRFSDYDAQVRCLAGRHKIDGRWCEVNLPNSQGDAAAQHTNRKIFVARCTEDLTTDDLKEYFEQFGEVIDVFIPKPFRAFAFVSFADPMIAEKLCGEDHIIKGASVHISSAEPKHKDQKGGDDRYSGRTGPGARGSLMAQQQQQDHGGWGGNRGGGGGQDMGNDSMNNIGMNMLSSAMLAAAQAVFQGNAPQGSDANYQLGPGFGGTRDSRGQNQQQQQQQGYSTAGGASTWGSGDNQQGQTGYSQGWGKTGNAGGYSTSGNASNMSNTQWGTQQQQGQQTQQQQGANRGWTS